jgi:ATP-dependent protease ClpP protease subunit
MVYRGILRKIKNKSYRGAFARIIFCLFLTGIFLPAGFTAADTFVNTETNETYHGYATGEEDDGLSEVFTTEKGLIKINLGQFDITPDRTGRNNTVALLSIPDEITLGMETRAFEDAIKEAASKGPLFILIEIDSPGGRIDMAMRICSAIGKTANCDTYAYINGGGNGGAYSAAAAIALSCNRTYMAPGTVIGAASLLSVSSEGLPVDISEVLSETVSEKLNSGWRSYFASLAQNNNRPAVLAEAMVDKNIEVIEVIDNGKRIFIESVNKKPEHKVVKTWSKAGSLLTLPVKEAVECGIADKIYNSRRDLLRDNDALSAKVIDNESMEKARQLCARIEKSLKDINASIDLGVKQLRATRSRGQSMKAMRSLMDDARFVLGLKRKFGDDVPINEKLIQSFLNSVQAEYDAIKDSRQ